MEIVKQGQIFDIIRKENPSTGYTYFKEELSNGLSLIRSKYIPRENIGEKQIFGASGVHLWRIKANQSGKQNITLYLGQEWDRSTWTSENIIIYVEL
jgi:predicted secreted protein